MADLPQELINKILLWLPVKSLLRFRCVTKSFCALIGSQPFINSHFQRCSANNIHRKLIELVLHETDDNFPKVHALEFNDDFQQEWVLDLYQFELYVVFFSYCNGLVLLYILSGELHVWNPSTKKHKILPALPVKNVEGKVSFGLGYDSAANDYKAVVIISDSEKGFSQVWIFELRASCWRRIQDFPYADYFETGGNGDCFVDGALHFRCYHGNVIDASHIIVAFYVAKETFFVLHDPIFQPGVTATWLHVYGGCLSTSLYSLTTRDRVDMYVRKKDGVTFTWTRLYYIEKQQFIEQAFVHFAVGKVAYSKEGNKVLLSSNGKLCSYDFKEKSLQDLVTTKSELSNTTPSSIFSYSESLMSVDL